MTTGKWTTRAGAALGAPLLRAAALPGGGLAATDPAGEGGAGTEGTTLAVGETATFGDGLRVFLSRVAPESEMARVTLNGLEAGDVALHRGVVEGGCKLTMTGVAEGEATFAGACGAEAVAAAQAAQGTGTPLAVRQTATFGEEQRIFMSKLDHGNEAARPAENGFELVTLGVGETADVQGCTVALVGLDGGGRAPLSA